MSLEDDRHSIDQRESLDLVVRSSDSISSSSRINSQFSFGSELDSSFGQFTILMNFFLYYFSGVFLLIDLWFLIFGSEGRSSLSSTFSSPMAVHYQLHFCEQLSLSLLSRPWIPFRFKLFKRIGFQWNSSCLSSFHSFGIFIFTSSFSS